MVGDDPLDVVAENLHGESEAFEADGDELAFGVEEIGGTAAFAAEDGEAFFIAGFFAGVFGGDDPAHAAGVDGHAEEEVAGVGLAVSHLERDGQAGGVEGDHGDAAVGLAAEVSGVEFLAVGAGDADGGGRAVADPVAEDDGVALVVDDDADHFAGGLLKADGGLFEFGDEGGVGGGVFEFDVDVFAEEGARAGRKAAALSGGDVGLHDVVAGLPALGRAGCWRRGGGGGTSWVAGLSAAASEAQSRKSLRCGGVRRAA